MITVAILTKKDESWILFPSYSNLLRNLQTT